MTNYGIALSGGGTRGAAHVGVLSALDEAGILPSSVAGTSAGSIVGGLYAAGFTSSELSEIVLTLSQTGTSLLDPDLKGLLYIVRDFLIKSPNKFSGIFKGNKLETFLCNLTQGRMMTDIPIKLVIPSVDLNSGNTIAFTNTLPYSTPIGKIVWEKNISLCKAIRASSSVPGIFQPILFNSALLVDGGVTDILPVDLLISIGVTNVLAVDISEEYSAPAEVNLIEIASHSFSLMSDRLRNYVEHAEKYRLKLDLPQQAGLLTFKHMEECMQIGYETTKQAIPTIKKALGLY